jgi:hypothetical protein
MRDDGSMATPGGSHLPSLPSLIPGADGYMVPPPGRWTCSRAQFEAAFVQGGRPIRQRLVDDLDTYWDQQTRHGLAVLSYWIGGSFVSDKAQPGDIDVTAVIDGGASSPDKTAQDWINPRDKWKHQVHSDVGRLLLLDGFAVVKYPDGSPLIADYYRLRGHWDDWWQRSRASGQALTRGYVEVVDWK